MKFALCASLTLALTLGGCAESAPPKATGPLRVSGVMTLREHMGDTSGWRRATRQLNGLNNVHTQFTAQAVTGDVFVTRPGREVAFQELDLQLPASLHFQLAIEPIEAIGTSGLRVEVVGTAKNGFEAKWTTSVAVDTENAIAAAEVELPLSSAGIERLDRMSMRIVPSDPDAVRGAFALGLIRPHARFEREGARPEREPRQVFIVTLDTLRSDHLGCYGHPDARTESLDAFAQDAVRFENAFSVSNVTNPSHTSIFSSLHPKDHAVRDNFARLPADLPTIMSGLSEHGFQTAAFTAAANFEPDRLGLDEHFDDFFATRGFWERRAEDVNHDVFEWLGENYDRDFFAWVHYFDVHMPYQPPAPYDSIYTSDVDEGEIELPLRTPEQLAIYGEERSLRDFKNRYLGELAYMDDRFGEFIERLRSLEIYDRAIIVVVADHGEAHGEYGVYCEHAGLHDVVTSVPLLIKVPGQKARGVVGGLVSTLDVFPTVYDWLDLPIRHRVRGRSLRSSMESGEDSSQGVVFSEHSHTLQISARSAEDRAVLGLADKQVFPAFGTEDGKVELHAIRNGRQVLEDQSASQPAEAGEMRTLLESFLEDRIEYEAGAIEDSDYLERLQKLGYTK